MYPRKCLFFSNLTNTKRPQKQHTKAQIKSAKKAFLNGRQENANLLIIKHLTKSML